MKYLTISLFSIFALLGCAKNETYTVDFLKTNDAKRAEVLADCKANKQSDENCKNANEADAQVKTAEFDKKQNR